MVSGIKYTVATLGMVCSSRLPARDDVHHDETVLTETNPDMLTFMKTAETCPK